VQPLSLDKFGDPLHPSRLSPRACATCGPPRAATSGSSRPDSRAHPAITLNYLSTLADQGIAAQSLRIVRRIITGTQTMQRYSPEEFVPGPGFQSEEELVKAAGNVGTTIFHRWAPARWGARTTRQRWLIRS